MIHWHTWFSNIIAGKLRYFFFSLFIYIIPLVYVYILFCLACLMDLWWLLALAQRRVWNVSRKSKGKISNCTVGGFEGFTHVKCEFLLIRTNSGISFTALQLIPSTLQFWFKSRAKAIGNNSSVLLFPFPWWRKDQPRLQKSWERFLEGNSICNN